MGRTLKNNTYATIYKNCRCNICNSVSSSEISSDYGEVNGNAFYKDPDPKRYGFVCHTCMEEIQEIRSVYDLEDELDG